MSENKIYIFVLALFMTIIFITCINNIMTNINLTDFHLKVLKYITLFSSVKPYIR